MRALSDAEESTWLRHKMQGVEDLRRMLALRNNSGMSVAELYNELAKVSGENVGSPEALRKFIKGDTRTPGLNFLGWLKRAVSIAGYDERNIDTSNEFSIMFGGLLKFSKKKLDTATYDPLLGLYRIFFKSYYFDRFFVAGLVRFWMDGGTPRIQELQVDGDAREDWEGVVIKTNGRFWAVSRDGANGNLKFMILADSPYVKDINEIKGYFMSRSSQVGDFTRVFYMKRIGGCFDELGSHNSSCYRKLEADIPEEDKIYFLRL